MALYDCLESNQIGKAYYRKGSWYEFSSDPGARFALIPDEAANARKDRNLPLPCWRDIEKDYHIDVPTNWDGDITINSDVIFDNIDGTGIQKVVAWNSGNGVITWQDPLVVQVSPTEVSWAAGTARFVSGDSDDPQVVYVEFPAGDTVTDDYIATAFRTHWAIDQTGTMFQFEEEITAAEKQSYVQLFVTTHFGLSQVDLVSPSPEIGYETGNKLIDLQDAVRFINFNGGNAYSPEGSTNLIEKSGGQCWANSGRNFATDAESPNVAVQTAISPIAGVSGTGFPLMFCVYQDGSGGTLAIPNISGEIPTTTYDDGSGTPATLPDGYWVTDRIFMEPSQNVTALAHGQTIHKGKVSALQSINLEDFTKVPGADEFILRGAITYRKGETGFLNNPNVIFSTADKYGTVIVNSSGGNPNLGIPTYKSSGFTSRGVLAGTYYAFGYYQAPAADANLTQASTTVALGTANVAYGAHAFAVFGGAGTVDSGTVGLRVTGTSTTDGAMRTPGDIEVLTTDITSVALDQYVETSKKWIGQVVLELFVTSGTPTVYSADFNYGLAKYEDFGNRDCMLTDIEVVGLAGVNDALANVSFKLHSPLNWTYSAAGFVPGNGTIADMSADYVVENDLSNGENFAYKRADLQQLVLSASGEGLIVELVSGGNNTYQFLTAHLGVEF
jgi:hypothetical protein